MPKCAYACYNKNEEVRMSSSSGGIYSLLAEKILEDGGEVFAACYDRNLEVSYRKINSIDELPDSRGSKYVASHMGNVFQDVLDSLQKGIKVLFVGTPCQCEGLMSFLGKRYDNLVCVDFICHGIPGRIPWRKYLESMKNRGSELVGINMRDKTSGWSKWKFCWKMVDNFGNTTFQPQSENFFVKGFIANIYLRPSCYNCQFKGIERKTDFTLGDYWGVWNIQPEMDDNKGISLVLVHSQKGQKLFDSVSSSIVYTNAFLDKAIKYNSPILSSVKCSDNRKVFYKRINEGEDFIKIMEDLTRISFKDKLKIRIKRSIKKIFKIFNY